MNSFKTGHKGSTIPDSRASTNESTKKKRDQKRFAEKKKTANKQNVRQQGEKAAEVFAANVEKRVEAPIQVPVGVAPYVVDNRIYTGVIHPVGRYQLAIDGWHAIDFPTEYIDWTKKVVIKKRKKIVLTIENFILRADGLLLDELEKILWGYLIPSDFRGFESGQVNNPTGKEGKMEIVDQSRQDHIKRILDQLNEEEMADQESLTFPEIDEEIHKAISLIVKDEPTVALHLNLHDGHYYQFYSGVYYNYSGVRHNSYSWDAARKIRKFKPATFSTKNVPIVCLKFFKRPLPLPKIYIRLGASPELVQEVGTLFGVDLRLLQDAKLPTIIDLLLGLSGYQNGHYILPPDALLPQTTFRAQSFVISWGLNSNTVHPFWAGGILVAKICGFPIFRIPKGVMLQPRFKPDRYVQLYPNHLSQGWLYWFISWLGWPLALFPTLGFNKWLWRKPKWPGMEVYRSPHTPERALYIIRFVEPTMPNKEYFIPGWFLRATICEVAARSPDRNWMSQVSSLLMKLVGVMNLPSWVIQPLTLALYMDFHERVGGVLFKHLFTFNPQFIAFTDVRNQRPPSSKNSFMNWISNGKSWFVDRTSNWIFVLITFFLLMCTFLPSYLVPQHPGRLVDAYAAMRVKNDYIELPMDMIAHVCVEEIAKYFLPQILGLPWWSAAVVMGTMEWYIYGPTGFPNFIMHTITGCMPLPLAWMVHMAYNFYVLNSNVNWHTACIWEALASLMTSTRDIYDTCRYGMQEFYLIPPWSYLGQLYDQAIQSTEPIVVMVFDLPLQFAGAINKWSDYTLDFLPTSPNIEIKFLDPVTGQVNVLLKRLKEKFNLEDVDNRRDTTMDERFTRSGTVLYGLAYVDMLPRRQQSLDVNSWTSLIEYRLKRTNTYSIPFKTAVWKMAEEYTTRRVHWQPQFNAMEEEYGLLWHNGTFVLDVSCETDARRRSNMLKHFEGPKKKDYLKGYDELFDRVVISNDFPWPKNYSLIVERYAKRMKTISLAHKRDELLLKKGDIKPRPIFSVPLLTRCLTGPFLWAFKQAVYMNNYPFYFKFERKAAEFLLDSRFLETAVVENLVSSDMLAMGATPLEISLWFTLHVIHLSGSMHVANWLEVQTLWSDGSAYDLSGTSVDHLLFGALLKKSNVPAEVADMVADFVASKNSVIIDRLKAEMELIGIFQTGMSETTIFNTLRNVSSASLTFKKFKISHAQIAGGDDYLALLDPGVTQKQATALIKDFEADQLLMGVTSKCGIGKLPKGDFYSSLLVPAVTRSGHEVLILTLKIGKLLKSGASHSDLAHTNPWDVLYDTSYVWEKVTRHLPIANAIARFHKRLAIAKGGRKILNERLIGNPNLDWRSEGTLEFYKALSPSRYLERYMLARYNISWQESEELIEFIDELPMQTVIINHPVLKKIVEVDLE